jgi:hypothetical protein
MGAGPYRRLRIRGYHEIDSTTNRATNQIGRPICAPNETRAVYGQRPAARRKKNEIIAFDYSTSILPEFGLGFADERKLREQPDPFVDALQESRRGHCVVIRNMAPNRDKVDF